MTLPRRRDASSQGIDLLRQAGLAADIASACEDLLQELGLEDALAHSRRQSRTEEQFMRQFHQWFDAFRTLKYLHALRDNLWPMQALTSLWDIEPRIWPDSASREVAALQTAVRAHWHWLSADDW